MYGGESGEASHVRLGPVQGVEPVPPPHQHPSRSAESGLASSHPHDFLDNQLKTSISINVRILFTQFDQTAHHN